MTLRTLGTAGHIDHGKTSLVEALTGTNTDRLAEERRRGISIELGYALLDLGDGVELSVVDVPGHERFVRTMVAGATGIDLALVCIACDDGVMPQTREHLAILDLLGVRHAVIALTKRDIVDDDGAELARADVDEALAGTALQDAPRVEVSVRTGAGLDDLRAAIRSAAAAPRPISATGRTRLPVDRVFSMRGIGTVVTGTLWGGELAVGDRVTLLPGGAAGRVRSLQRHDRDVAHTSEGGRVAVCLVGVERHDIARGATIVRGALPPSSYRLDVAVRPVEGARGVRDGDLVEVLHGTAGRRARVVEIAAGLAQLRLDAALATVRGDRLVIRSLAPAETVAGAVVADPAPARHRGGADAEARLRTLLADDDAAVLAAFVQDRPGRAIDAVAAGLLDPAAAAAAERDLVARRSLVALADGWLITTCAYESVVEAARQALVEQAREHPLTPALPLSRVAPRGPFADALLARLERDGVIERRGAEAAIPGTAAIADTFAEASDRLLAALAVEPRLADALARTGLDAATGRELVAHLERERTLVRLPDGLGVPRETYDEACRIVVEGCRAAGRFTLAELRDATGTSRRYAQALLERMDADGFTRRVGDHRILRRRAEAVEG